VCSAKHCSSFSRMPLSLSNPMSWARCIESSPWRSGHLNRSWSFMTDSRREIALLRPPRIRSASIRNVVYSWGGDLKHNS
jgi:hypothetical protein